MIKMIFKDQYDPSLGRKSVFTICITFSVSVSILLMYIEHVPSFPWLQPYQISGDFVRRTMIAGCLIIYFVRLQVTVWIFQKRFWTWFETITISLLMTFVLFAFARSGGNNEQAVGIIEAIGLLLYLCGSFINTFSELHQTHLEVKSGKQKPALHRRLISLCDAHQLFW